MNISNIILQLQTLLSTATDSYIMLALSKAIEKLKVGSVSVVSTTANLPSATSSLVGEIYLVEEDNDLYVNIGSQWNSLDNKTSSILQSWGSNGSGRLGDGTETQRSSPVTVVGGITNWSQVEAGNRHSLGVTSDGTAYAWGYNSFGQLGTGNTINQSSPVTVVGGITNWSQVEGGGSFSLGLTSDGIAYAWGSNYAGVLGDGTTTGTSSPVTVIGGITNWAQVAAGGAHSLGVTSTGIAYAWGWNNGGRLGTGNTTNRSSPATVVGGITNWAQVAAGGHSLGVTSTGIAYAWGPNDFGILGDGTETSRTSPVTVVGGITNWSQVSANDSHSLGVTSSGIAYAWGRGQHGRLGDGTITNRSSPVTVIGGITNWSQVSAGLEHSLGVTSNGVAYAWGRNNSGQLGDESTSESRESPVIVVGNITNWSQVSAGDHSLGLTNALLSVN